MSREFRVIRKIRPRDGRTWVYRGFRQFIATVLRQGYTDCETGLGPTCPGSSRGPCNRRRAWMTIFQDSPMPSAVSARYRKPMPGMSIPDRLNGVLVVLVESGAVG